jgi:4-hydroxythreonine-4-phosphate dehydrogenase
MSAMTALRPIIGITMGDPAGVGPEVVVRALSTPTLRDRARFVIFGFSEQLAYTADQLELPWRVRREHHEDIRRFPDDVVVLDYDEISQPAVLPRGPSKLAGRASMAFCQDAIDAALENHLDALVTAPISKSSWHMAGFKNWPGHTELLKYKCRAPRVAMMFVAPQLKVVLATIHLGLMEIRDKFTIGAVYNPIDLADEVLREWFGIERPRIAVCGLNPHAGEEGQFGDEERRVIRPAIVMASENGVDVTGPFPADTLFIDAVRGLYDCVIAMYHDQGLIPVKLLAWRDAVNVTLGLPIIRTSPDHGTAFDIAGRFKADPASMIAATRLAIELAEQRLAAKASGPGSPGT